MKPDQRDDTPGDGTPRQHDRVDLAILGLNDREGANRLCHAIRRFQGVEDVSVNLAASTGRIVYGRNEVDISSLCRKLSRGEVFVRPLSEVATEAGWEEFEERYLIRCRRRLW